MRRLKDKIAVVTGGSLGIGKATCKLFAEEGATVVITDIMDEEGKNLEDQITNETVLAKYWHLDVSDENEVKEVMKQIESKYKRIDILVNNAGIAGASKPTHLITSEEWDKVMNVNVKGVFYCTKYVIPGMIENKQGSIVNLSSIYGLISSMDVPPYHASKGAVRLMTKTDALFYAPYNVRVNSVHPGFIWTPMVENYLKSSGDMQKGLEFLNSMHPIGHIGEPEDIAYGILYLASDESKFVTGSELVIDGGYTAK